MNYGTCWIRGHPGGRYLVPINTWLNREGSYFPVCSWLQCLVCWRLSHDLSVVSVLAYHTCRLWCCDCVFLLLVFRSFWGHSRTISLLGLVKLFADVSVQVCGGLLRLIRYSILASSGHPATIWSMVSWNRSQILHIWVCTIFRIVLQ